MRYEELTIEGRNAVMEAFRSGKTIDKLFVLKNCQDGPVNSILREARKHDVIVSFVAKERLDQMSKTGKHQGVIASAAAYEYAEVEDILNLAREKGEPPFIFLLDNIEDPQWSNYPYCQSGRCSWRHHSETSCCGADGNRSKDICRCPELHSGCKGDESGCYHGGTEERRTVVCLRGYGRNDHVRPESDGPDWISYWK